MFAVFKRELFSLFVTPLAWVVLTTFALLQGVSFYVIVSHFAASQDVAVGDGPLQMFLGGTWLAYLPPMLLCPLLTMRLFAEERRSGTIEALLTAPVTPLAVVMAKYLAAFTTYAVLWAPTLFYVLIVARSGEIDTRIVVSGYAGLLLMGAGYIAIGTVTSALTKNQLAAAAISGVVIIGLFIVGVAGNAFPNEALREISSHVSLVSMLGEFSRGLIHTKRLVFALTVVALPLFWSVRIVESWRWG